MASDGLEQLDEKTNIAKPLIGAENLLSFYREEQKKAIDQALEILSTERNGLSTLFGYIVHEVKSGEVDISELHPIPGRNITPPEESLGSKSYKWAEKAAEVLSYLLYALQIEAYIYEGIFEGTRRRIEAPEDASNEILYLLTRQVIISVGGMEECLHGKTHTHTKGEGLRLSDVLVKSIVPEDVQTLYKNFLGSKKHTFKSLQRFLKHLEDKGYYSCKLTNNDIEAIGRNDFDERFKFNNTSLWYPPRKDSDFYNDSPFNRVPPIR
jgi:hypothetical protein